MAFLLGFGRPFQQQQQQQDGQLQRPTGRRRTMTTRRRRIRMRTQRRMKTMLLLLSLLFLLSGAYNYDDKNHLLSVGCQAVAAFVTTTTTSGSGSSSRRQQRRLLYPLVFSSSAPATTPRRRTVLLQSSPRTTTTAPAASSSPPAADAVRQSRQSSNKPKTKMKKPVVVSSQQLRSKNNPTSNKRTKSKNKNYKRQSIPQTERRVRAIKAERKQLYRQLQERHKKHGRPPSIWSFESLFPQPKYDVESIEKDLKFHHHNDNVTAAAELVDTDGGDSPASSWTRESGVASTTAFRCISPNSPSTPYSSGGQQQQLRQLWKGPTMKPPPNKNTIKKNPMLQKSLSNATESIQQNNAKIDPDLTQLVEDRVYGMRRNPQGQVFYETSLLSRDSAVQFKDGIRLGNPLKINADLLTYHGRRELQHGKIDEAKEFYELARNIDPRDGRGYLGLARCAERRRDFLLAKKHLLDGIQNSVSICPKTGIPDKHANPYLLQTMGCLEEKLGNLGKAEEYYISATQSRPSHAAAWVSLAQLRTRKLGYSKIAGRQCFENAQRELENINMTASSYIYTAWGDLEASMNNVKQARELFQKALDYDPKCSTAFLQLGVLEANCENYDLAEEYFEKVLTFDQRNTRVLQAYAIMETKRDNSRKAIGLFERALQTKPRDAAVLQAYALYVDDLGDVTSARQLLERATKANKRHAAAWQAWGVLEMRQNNMDEARNIFQQGIWNCGQLTGIQSGGYHCARLWQAWGILEAKVGEYAAARRCFSRALDANSRNIPTFTAWANLEEDLGNIKDARMIYEKALRQFAPGSDDKMTIWRTYELMEQRLGHVQYAQAVYQRSMRESMTVKQHEQQQQQQQQVATAAAHDATKASSPEDESSVLLPRAENDNEATTGSNSNNNKKNKEVEAFRWESTGGEVWMNDRAIESKVPMKKKKKNNKKIKNNNSDVSQREA